MSDSAPRTQGSAPQMLADALLRSVAGTSALLRVTAPCASTDQSEVGLLASSFSEVVLSPVVMRRLRPTTSANGENKWELLVSASSVARQLSAMDVASAQELFAMTLAVTVAAQEFTIESIASNEAFGQVYLYRLSLREAGQHSL